MRRSLRAVALATLLASCSDFPQQPTGPSTMRLGGTANLPDLPWGRSTTGVPMFVMGTHNGLNVIPLDVNDAGVIVGILRSPTSGVPDRAFKWENGNFTIIGPASGTPASAAKAISEAGVISGFIGSTGVLWTASGIITLPSSANGSQAAGLNEAQMAVGADFISGTRWNRIVPQPPPPADSFQRRDFFKPSGSTAVAFDINSFEVSIGRITATSPPFGRAVRWNPGFATATTTIVNPPNCAVMGFSCMSMANPHAFQGGKVINDAGNWVANFQNGSIRAYRNRASVWEQLPVLSATGTQTYANGIGENGEVVGTSMFAPDTMHAVVWALDNSIRDLGMIEGGTNSTANAANREGWAVGTSQSVVDGVTVTVGVIWRTSGDDTPPVVELTVEGTQGQDGWYTSNVQVQWSVSDPESGIQGSQGCQAQGVFSDTPGVTYTCTATNTSNLSTTHSVTIKRDGSAPVINTSIDGTPGTNGWYRSDVVVSMTASDAHSGVASSQECVPHNVVEDIAAISFTCSATNGAGLSASETVTLKRDATNPVITFGEHPPVYEIDEIISIPCQVSDAMSGIATHSCSTFTGDAYRGAVGNRAFTVQATDNAGNTIAVSSPFTVLVTLEGLARLTLRLVPQEGIANALTSKLGSVASHLMKGNTKAAEQAMETYVSQLRELASKGVHVAPGDAQLLMQLSGFVPLDGTQASATLKKVVRQ